MKTSRQSQDDFQFLSELLFPASDARISDRRLEVASVLREDELDAMTVLAAKNHVTIRAFCWLGHLLKLNGGADLADRVSQAMEKESSRIHHALGFLDEIVATLEQNDCPVTVIKSLDHWPDLGSDLDLYTDVEPAHVVSVMREKLQAKVEERSWGDRLANKWNFVVPGLDELVEIHAGRLGQTGEQTLLTKSLSQRTRILNIGRHSYRVLAHEDRIVVSTLQRMYRHFYLRLCDVLDTADLLESEVLDFPALHSLGSAAGIWEGIATYLAIISGYVKRFRGRGIPLPGLVTASAKFGVDEVRYGRDFLRVPILPHSLNLFAGELRTLVMRGEVRNSLRLSLLPGLATAAALEMKLTGSDKGIW